VTGENRRRNMADETGRLRSSASGIRQETETATLKNSTVIASRNG